MESILQLYQRRLTNLTGSNRSLLLRRLKTDHFIDVSAFDYLQPNIQAFALIESLIEGKAHTLGPVFDARDEHLNRVSKRLKTVGRTAKFISEERGTKDLYIGWPFVEGRFADDTPVRCPLLFYPVELLEENGKWIIKLRDGVAVQFNKSFLLAYAHYHQTELPEKLYEKAFNDWEKDSRVYRTKLYSLLKESPVTLNFNQELFLDELQNFTEYKAKEFLEHTASGELRLQPQAVLGIFPQAGSYLVPDYNRLIEENPAADLEVFFKQRHRTAKKQSFEGKHPLVTLGQQVKEESLLTPYELDASQETALRAAKAGASVVVQGPPGTGKSQLIANLIADFAARGKRVLLVSQKKAALDVVFNRLDQKQLSDFVALVHDFKADRKKLYAQITSQIDRVGEYKNLNSGLDTIQLERQFQKISRRIEQIKEELKAFKEALFDENEYGKSIKELYLTTNSKGSKLDLRQEFKYYTLPKAEAFLAKLKTYQRLNKPFKQVDHPWANRQSFSKHSLQDKQQMLDYIAEAQQYRKSITEAISNHLQKDITYETVEYLTLRQGDIEKLLTLIEKPEVYDNLQHMLGYKANSISEEKLHQLERSLMQCYEGDGPEISLPPGQLGRYQELLQNRLRASRSLYKLMRWKFFVAEQTQVQQVLQDNNLADRRKDVHILIKRLDNRLNLEHNLSQIKAVPWLKDLPLGYKQLDFQQWFRLQKKTMRAWQLLHAIRNMGLYFNLKKLSYPELKSEVEQMLQLINDLQASKEIWLHYFSPIQIEQILSSESRGNLMASSLEAEFDFLVELDQLLEGLNEYDQELIKRVKREADVQQVAPEEVQEWFINSLQAAWIQHIENKYPVLRTVSTKSLQALEQELQQCIQEKAGLSEDMVVMRTREHTYNELEYNRLNNQVTFRDLRHQTTKKRKIWPIRRLVSQFDDELMRIMPCWMASPEAVSAIFPMRELFDIVIFDEASQCFVEKGIPAIARAKQVVISGDSKQLQPNDLYQVRWEEDDEDDPDTEIESLLDLGVRYLPSTNLTGHYRSQLPELIHFSNKHFYNHSLEVIPDRHRVNKAESGINFVKVNGVWEDNTNQREAEEVVRLLLTLLAIEKEQEYLSGQEGVPWYVPKTFGVVTFNAKQQILIQELLEQEAAKKQLLVPESLFVKNIENVQGDERDIILFSVGYAPDRLGNMRMQFGSLNTAHGENRLNVAISRAREYIYVVSSIEPEQLKVEDSLHAGPKLFKAYLAYAREVSVQGFTPKPKPLPATGTYSKMLKSVVSEELKTLEYDIIQQQPFSDLTARHLGKYAGVLLTDDNQYYLSPTLKESHAYIYSHLEKKHWPYLRIYSREYYNNAGRLYEEISRFLNHIDVQG